MYTAIFSVAIVATLSTTASAVFNAAAKTNVITYWGQGANQDRLLTTCQNSAYDIINIGFVNVFPDQGAGGWPGTNFGNACWGDVYQNNGVNTSLLKTCPDIGPDVIACQQTYGKKIFLSIGGGEPTSYYIKNNKSGKSFANFLWAAFGPSSATQTDVPRPWGDAGVDGFDFDIENLMDPAPQADYQTSGYAAMITQFKNVLFPTDTSKSYYISGAPQCVIPDSHLSAVLSSAWFDFFTIQFYNTASCSARAAIQKANGKGTNDISYQTWTTQTSKNPNVKMSIGLPGSNTAATAATYYLTPAEAQSLVKRFYSNAKFGGIMVWEATAAQNNVQCTLDYGTFMKNILLAKAAGTTYPTNVKTCAGISKKRSIQAPRRPVQFAADTRHKRADVDTVTTTITSVYTGSLRTTISGRLYTGTYEETSFITSAYVPTIESSAAPKQTYAAPSSAYTPSSAYIPVSSSSEPIPTSYAAPTSTSYASLPSDSSSSSPESLTVYASSPTSAAPEPSRYTSYNTITVVPVPASSSVSESAAAQGTSSGALSPSSSALPTPATGAASSQRLSLAAFLCGLVVALFA